MLDPTNERAFADHRKSTGGDAIGVEKPLFSGVSGNVDPMNAPILAAADPNPAIAESTKAAAALAGLIRVCESDGLESLKARIGSAQESAKARIQRPFFKDRPQSVVQNRPPKALKCVKDLCFQRWKRVCRFTSHGRGDNLGTGKSAADSVLSAIRQRKDKVASSQGDLFVFDSPYMVMFGASGPLWLSLFRPHQNRPDEADRISCGECVDRGSPQPEWGRNHLR
ncbi:hypothetical protein ACFSHP_19565 [Novosphingobium panipatense]